MKIHLGDIKGEWPEKQLKTDGTEFEFSGWNAAIAAVERAIREGIRVTQRKD